MLQNPFRQQRDANDRLSRVSAIIRIRASKVHAGDPVTLVPEPENYFDKNALRVICYGKMIGSIAKDLAASRSQALAKQGRVSGVISKKFPGIKKTGYNVGLRLCITIRDSEP